MPLQFRPVQWQALVTDIIQIDFLRGQNLNFEILRKKMWKNITKNHLICVKNEEKTVKEVKLHKFLFAHVNLKILR